MKRLLLLTLGVLLAAAPAFAQAKASSKTLSATGKVSAITADSVTVKGKTGEWTFAVDKDTDVTAKGASTKTAAAKADNKATPITTFVKVGDDVAVKYHDMGATKHAASVTVRYQPPPAKK